MLALRLAIVAQWATCLIFHQSAFFPVIFDDSLSNTCIKCSFFMPPPFQGGPSRPVPTKNGFQAISFEYISVLDSYFIHIYIIIKYRSSLITDKIHQLL